MNIKDVELFGNSYTAGLSSDVMNIKHFLGYSVHFAYDDITPAASDALTGRIETQTVTFPSGADAVSGDYFALTDTTGKKWAVSLQKKNIETLTFPAKATVVTGDFIIVYDTAGTAWGISLNVTGSDPQPTSALWTAIPAGKKVSVDISATNAAPSVAAAVELAVDALTGFSAVITTDDGAADGTMTFAQASIGYVIPAIPSNAIGDGAGTITKATTVLGSNAPTGAIWTAIPAAQKAQATITAAQTNAQVSAAVETILDGLTDLPFTTTVSTNTIICANTVRGNTPDGAVKNKTDATAGTMTVGNTTQGLNPSVNVTDNTITIASHGYAMGLKGQLTISGGGTLPDGLLAGTDYFVIVDGLDTIKLAASLANAIAGTDIDIIDQGTADKTITFTPTALAGCSAKIQYSNDGVQWDDVASGSVSITADGNKMFNLSNCYYSYVKAVFAITAGRVALSGKFFSKGD